jgi:exodeoxyribonuclease-3
MEVATYNANGINARLPVLLRWLEESQPHIVCLQELKAPQEKFPEASINDLGYDAFWQGQKLEWSRHTFTDRKDGGNSPSTS